MARIQFCTRQNRINNEPITTRDRLTLDSNFNRYRTGANAIIQITILNQIVNNRPDTECYPHQHVSEK